HRRHVRAVELGAPTRRGGEGRRVRQPRARRRLGPRRPPPRRVPRPPRRRRRRPRPRRRLAGDDGRAARGSPALRSPPRRRMSAPDYRPPERFRGASFASYRPQTPSQDRALQEARRFAERVRRRHLQPRFLRWLRPEDELGAGLYLVGPVGTGKTHLLAALY